MSRKRARKGGARENAGGGKSDTGFNSSASGGETSVPRKGAPGTPLQPNQAWLRATAT